VKVLIVNSDYPPVLDWLYDRHPGLAGRSYEEQLRARADSLFGVADFYSTAFGRLGHEAREVHANNTHLQAAWAREHGVRPRAGTSWRFRWHWAPPWVGVSRAPRWVYDVLTAQVKHYRPDILVNQAMDGIPSSFMAEVKPLVRLVVGQVAAPLPRGEDWGVYDLVVSSLPNFVERFRRLGVPAELNRLAFEPTVLDRVGPVERDLPFSFVGSFFPAHRDRVALLERLCARTGLRVWGNGVSYLSRTSPIRPRYEGNAWGGEMYRLLLRSKITLNHHIGVSGPYANNMRLYEATGAGCLLLTDRKVNLDEMFEPGKEVVTYDGPEECAELAEYYLNHEEERRAIAEAGQRRTLREHTYAERVRELADLLERRLRGACPVPS
jgi:hypothetical protein